MHWWRDGRSRTLRGHSSLTGQGRGLVLAFGLGAWLLLPVSAGCGDPPPTTIQVSSGDGGPVDAGAAPSDADAADAGRDVSPCRAAWGSAFNIKTRLVDRCGVFVAPWGDDGGPGTMKAPKRTIGAAMRASGASPESGLYDPYRVLVCNGTYEDSVLVEHRLTVQGGLTCDGGAWSYAPGTHGTLVGARAAVPSTPVFTARNPANVKDVGDVSIRDMELVARDADVPGASSLVLFADHSFGVELYQVSLVAGRGADGANGSAGTGALPLAVQGIDPVGDLPGNAVACFCADGVTVGGAGGAPGVVRRPGTPAGTGDDGSGIALSTAGQGGLGGLAQCTDMNGAGIGGTGVGAAEQTAGAGTALGTISSAGFRAARGNDGQRGPRGQGGGGGGARDGGGASGGCGGCGGNGGKGGQGGGASIALLDDHSAYVVLSHCRVSTANGGNGGRGGAGQSGQPGAPGGADPSGLGCAGGRGGDGARGQAGSGGPGGLSVAILLAPALEISPNEPTKKPLLEDASRAAVTLGKAGRGGGDEGAPGRGPDGVAATELTLPR